MICFFTVGSIFSQDLIVTTNGDSINCKILKIKSDYIYFTLKHKEEIRNTLLQISDVTTHQFDFYTISEVPKEKIVGYENYPHFRAAVNAGYSHRIAKIAPEVDPFYKNYIDELKSGFHFGADGRYFCTERLGIGLNFNLFKSSNSLGNVWVEDAYGDRVYGIMSDNMTILFLGPSVSSRFLNHNQKNAFIMGVSIGYLGYFNNSKVVIEKVKISGKTLGVSYDLGYDFGLSENLSLGLQVSFLAGNISKFKYTFGSITRTVELPDESTENLSRIDFSAVFSFRK